MEVSTSLSEILVENYTVSLQGMASIPSILDTFSLLMSHKLATVQHETTTRLPTIRLS